MQQRILQNVLLCCTRGMGMVVDGHTAGLYLGTVLLDAALGPPISSARRLPSRSVVWLGCGMGWWGKPSGLG